MNVHSGTIVAKDDPLVLGTDPVPARYYFDPEWFELERKAIFMRSWINVGHVCELPEPGSFIRREIEFARASVIITRGKDGAINAFHNACTHRGTQIVSEPCGKKNFISWDMYSTSPENTPKPSATSVNSAALLRQPGNMLCTILQMPISKRVIKTLPDPLLGMPNDWTLTR